MEQREKKYEREKKFHYFLFSYGHTFKFKMNFRRFSYIWWSFTTAKVHCAITLDTYDHFFLNIVAVLI